MSNRMMPLVAHLDRVRREHGLLTIDEILVLAERGNVVFDPCSLLVSRGVAIGSGNVFYPLVRLIASGAGSIVIGDGNVFHPAVHLDATTGPIRIGDRNEFGDGGFSAKANRPGAAIEIGDEGRYQNGAAVFGATTLGSGSQILGPITADGCTLAPGGSHREPDPDRRAGLLKGTGTARGLVVPAGMVIVGAGVFTAENLRPQRDFHPGAPSSRPA